MFSMEFSEIARAAILGRTWLLVYSRNVSCSCNLAHIFDVQQTENGKGRFKNVIQYNTVAS